MSTDPAAASGRRDGLFVLTWVFCVAVGFTLLVEGMRWIASDVTTMPYRADFIVMIALVLVAELRPIVGLRYDAEKVSIAQAFAFATMYIWGWQPAVVLMAASVVLGEIAERKALWKVLFNVGQYSICVTVAGLALRPIGGTIDFTEFSGYDLLAIGASWVIYHLVNVALVAGVAGPRQTWWESFSEDFGYYTASTLAVLALSPLVAAVAVAGGPTGDTWLLLPLLMLPLLAVQRSAQMSQERERRATHDPLTGLPNRLALTDRIEQAIASSQGSGGRVVVVFLDLDLFKTINDGLGHAVGDDVLVQVSTRLQHVLRPGDMLARFSGDEFAIVCESTPDAEIDQLVTRVQDALQPPFTFGSHEVTVTASIGVTTATPHSTAESLLREADSAMYRAKTAGRDQVKHFHLSMHEAATARLDDQLGLRRALQRDELLAHYQPIIDLSSGRVLGMEALIRWQHPERGLLGPDQFIPLAEETGLIISVGTWMLEHSLEQLHLWRSASGETQNLWMAVNLSPRQLTDPDLAARIAHCLHRYELDPDWLHLEITETAVMQSADDAVATLAPLRDLGVRVIIDDFGTGYSSLARLKNLPVTALKIDRTFVDGLGTDASDQLIVDAITQMAHSLNLDVIAEGVETRQQLKILRSLGVTMGQGFLWSRPRPASGLADWIGDAMSPADLAALQALLRRG